MNELPLATKEVARVFNGFQTHSDWCRFGAERLQDGPGTSLKGAWRVRVRSLLVQGGIDQEFSHSCGCGRKWTKNFNPRKTL